MKTFITFIVLMLTVGSAAAQDYYQDKTFITINDSVVLRCSTFKSVVGIQSTKSYDYEYVEYPITWIKNRVIFKQALEEIFTPTELETYKDMILTFDFVHDAKLNPIDVSFSFDKEIGKTIPPSKFVKLRERLLQLVEFATTFRLTPGKYYSWSENIIAPLWYYRDPQYYLPKSRSRKTNQ